MAGPTPSRSHGHPEPPTDLDRAKLILLAICVVTVAAAHAESGSETMPSQGYSEAPPPSYDAELARQQRLLAQELYLEVVRDDLPTGRVVHVRLREGRMSAQLDELRSVGLEPPAQLRLSSDRWIALDTLPGLVYRYDPAGQRLFLTIPPRLRPLQALGYQPPGAVHVQRDAGWLIAYDFYGRSYDGQHSAALGHAARWFGRGGAVQTSGSLHAGDNRRSYRRLDTYWSYSDPERMSTWTAGDLISGGLAWSRPVRMAGVQWRRNFATRPDLITLPMPSFSADATVPSAVELYVNNVRQFGSQVQDGPFVLDTLPRISGAGQATLVVTDHLGRVSQTTVPLYIDQQRLAPGLSDFSVEVGLLRHGYGGNDDGYDSRPVVSASWRRGLAASLTLEGHGEIGPGLQLAGLGVAWSPANRWGLLTASYSHSLGDTQGSQHSLGYQWHSPYFGFDVQHLRRSAGYRDLGDLGNAATGFVPTLRGSDRATAWVPLPRGSLAMTWLRQRNGDQGSHEVRSLSWNQNIGERLTASATVFEVDGRIGAGLSVGRVLGERMHATVGATHNQDRISGHAGIRRSAPYQGGWGWNVQAGERSGRFLHASAQVRGRHGEAWFGIDHFGGRSGAFVQASGSVVRMDGHTFLSRYIHDGFAVVSTHGIADVLILSENRSYGRSNAAGYLLVPDLRSWQRNRLSIDPDDLDADVRVGDLVRIVTPAERSGVLVAFEIGRIQPALLVLMGLDDQPLPAGSRARIAASGEAVIVGFDGEVYLDDVDADTTIEFAFTDGRCLYRVPRPEPSSLARPRHRALACEWVSP
jgi:outer membrane usher protein